MYIYYIYSKTMANFAFSGMASGRVFLLGIRCCSTNPKSALKLLSGMWKFSKNMDGVLTKFWNF